MSAGNRAVWYNKKHPDCFYVDKRRSVSPDLVADVKDLPLYANQFDLICWDPPHMTCGPNSDMAKTYGYHTTKEILELLEKGSGEAHRVSKNNALMAFKWNTHDIKLDRVFKLMPDWEPLFGHLTKDGPRSQTYWVLFRKVSK